MEQTFVICKHNSFTTYPGSNAGQDGGHDLVAFPSSCETETEAQFGNAVAYLTLAGGTRGGGMKERDEGFRHALKQGRTSRTLAAAIRTTAEGGNVPSQQHSRQQAACFARSEGRRRRLHLRLKQQ